MRLTGLRVRNYRTVGSAEQTLTLGDGLTIVGPNNSGKTNLLRAIQLFFTGRDNVHPYERGRDLTFGKGNFKTALLATFDGNPGVAPDKQIYEALDSLHLILGTQRPSTSFTLSLQFPLSDTPTYQFFPNTKQPGNNATRTQFSRTQQGLVGDLLGLFECTYVPSARSMPELYDQLIVPFLRQTAAEAIQPHKHVIDNALGAVAKSFNDSLTAAGLTGFTASFQLPGKTVEGMLSTFDFNLSDPDSTSVFRKGQGIQSAAMLAGLLWITRQQTAKGKFPIWLIEEPESYLHPELSHSAASLLDALRQEALVVTTTHSLAFVPTDPARVCGTELLDSRTHINTFSKFHEATASLRNALGVRFGDFYNLGLFNLLLEGQSDRELIQWFLQLTPPAEYEWEHLRNANLMDFGGVKNLEGFLRATYEFIRIERSTVAVFDGDDAGRKAINDLQQVFGQRNIPFQANDHYVVVRSGFAIEGLFPDEWVQDLHAEHPNWFDTYNVDVSGVLDGYRIKSSNKNQLQNRLCRRAEEANDDSWRSRWLVLAKTLDALLKTRHDKLPPT